MAIFQHLRTRFDGVGNYISAVSGLVVQATGGGVFTASGQHGGLLARDIAQNLAITATQGFTPLAPGLRAGEAELTLLDLGGRAALISFGQGPGARGFWLDQGPGFADAFTLPFSGTLLALHSVALGDGRDLIFTSALQSLGVTSWLRSATGQITPLQHIVPGNTAAGYDVLAMTVVTQGAGPLLLTVSAQGNALNAFRIDAAGHASLIDGLGLADGLAITAPNLVQSVRLAGQDYALLGAAGSSSIVVVGVAGDGHLRLVDQVNDDLNTRFQGISVLQTVTVEGRVFVVAGGADDGLSLMTLLPNGRLLHLATLADSLTTALENVSGLALRASSSGAGPGLDIFVTGWSETSLSQLRVDLGDLAPILTADAAGGVLAGDGRGDLILGGAGRDRLYGGAGDDILIDGAGADRLDGGAGADVFVFTADGSRDEVWGFDPAEDRLDLSGLGRIYSRASVGFVALADGIEIWAAGEKVILHSASGQPISAADLTDALLFDLSHAGPLPLINPGEIIRGSSGDDLLLGKIGGDTMIAGGGDDLLQGMDGADALDGGLDNDVINGGAGADRALFSGALGAVVDLEISGAQNTGYGWDTLISIEHLGGGAGNDSFFGNSLGNSLLGAGGNDRLWGRAGNDGLSGGTGNDLLFGGEGVDTLLGGEGADTLSGGAGNDLLDGGAGSDRVSYPGATAVLVDLGRGYASGGAAEGRDSLSGIEHASTGAGNDSLLGSAGGNSLVAGAGNDLLWGRAGADALWGQEGADRLYGEAGNDLLMAGAGNDLMNGGAGWDRAVFSTPGAVLVNLELGYASGPEGRDSLISVEQATTGAGKDRLIGSALANILIAGAGDDMLWGRAGNDALWGQSGRDTLAGEAGNDVLIGGAGNDRLIGGAGWDRAVFSGPGAVLANLTLGLASGAEGRDALIGIEHLATGAGNDRLVGSALANSLIAGAGDDMLWGRAGNDALWGQSGRDTLAGEVGNDVLIGGAGNDLLLGGAGVDRVQYLSAAAVLVNLATGQAFSTAEGRDRLGSIEQVVSGAGADRLTGNSAANYLAGNAGNDTLLGLGGNDVLLGGSGRNLLTGGAGADRFVFAKSTGGVQQISDFDRADRVQLQGFGYHSRTEALHHLHQIGGDVVFADQGLRITFAHSHLSEFTAGLFLL